MKKLECNPELMKIFIRNGFVDLTEKYHPQHVHKPDGKRVVSFPGTRVSVELDYSTLKSGEMTHVELFISKEELIAYICYHKLPSRMRQELQSYQQADRLRFMIDIIKKVETGEFCLGGRPSKTLRKIKELRASIILTTEEEV